MSDFDRDPQRPRETRRTTIVDTGERSGGGGVVGLILMLVIVVGIVWFLLHGRGVQRAAAHVGVNVAVPGGNAPRH